MASRRFRLSAVSVWNALPDNIRDAKTCNIFKRKPKIHLCKITFGTYSSVVRTYELCLFTHGARITFINVFIYLLIYLPIYLLTVFATITSNRRYCCTA